MRLAISNLSFPTEAKLEAYALINQLGAQGLEVAPTRIADWSTLTAEMCIQEARILTDNGLKASSLQAIFFGKPELQLLGAEGEFGAMLEHVKRIAELGSALGCNVAVFGAPKNRLRKDLSESDAFELAIERFSRLGETSAGSGLVFGIEAVPAVYGGDFLLDAQTAIRLVRAVGSENIRLHLDTACALLGEEDIASAVTKGHDVLAHFHISEPKLVTFRQPQADHRGAAQALRSGSYNGWLAIEMLSDPDWKGAIDCAIRYSQLAYAEVGQM